MTHGLSSRAKFPSENMISLIASLTVNRVIGSHGDLVFRDKADMARFKQITTGYSVIMGYKTYTSLPEMKPLPNRRNIILSRRLTEAPEGFYLAHSVEESLKLCNSDEVFVIGGGTVYEQFIGMADRLYLTRINKIMEGDTLFPQIKESEWSLTDFEIMNSVMIFETWDRKHN